MSHIITIDCHYIAPNHAAAYLLIQNDRAAFVDNNTSNAVPYLLQALADHGLTPEQVDYIIITHAHLDHAGGTAALLKHCPNAQVIAHPKAAKHIIDPERLVEGAKGVYGEELFEKLYGTIEGIPKERVQTVSDEEEIDWNGRTLRFLRTLGHATHHICIHDPDNRSIFSGDNFGVGRNEHLRPGPPFLMCSAAPPDFNIDEARNTIARILDTGAEKAYLPHFGRFEELSYCADMLNNALDLHEDIYNQCFEQGLENEALDAFCSEQVAKAFRKHLTWCNVDDVDAELNWLGADVDLNAQGLAVAVRRQRKKQAREAKEK